MPEVESVTQTTQSRDAIVRTRREKLRGRRESASLVSLQAAGSKRQFAALRTRDTFVSPLERKYKLMNSIFGFETVFCR